MAKVLVFQHVAAEPLGTLDPMLRARGHRIRYVNFHRDPDARPDIGRYDALIVLGGPQMPDQADRYPHLDVEIGCIEAALKKEIPVLGICLGAQLLAYALGAGVRPLPRWEIGWHDIEPTLYSAADPLFCALVEPNPAFHWHGYTFDLPSGAIPLAASKNCSNQAFRYGQNAWGLQCHLELDERLINRWLTLPEYTADLEAHGQSSAAELRAETHRLIGQSATLGRALFGQFLRPLGMRKSRQVLPSK
ncbi:MAG: gamma-glutamyl-gamma-aminobutyrate hydrolase family protein [Xanthomonadales bacterium]|jgi:GMP synthase (glutamine-hydrolysing)|nr:gamma-glutamyl-gamma-aminobutyrate hydrolase family protein [Xanthomonadales bacterium]